ncbi:hypothetical protein Athai_67440 [Actinocatenispora thailandica]|uniref:Uncharacterized protein n=1 Tax=Actinocatenispora thailandica TaxID=227318 RepID=A0A7R7DWP3_9ACTN|nr:hypothetical protein [Actinocatenispora thailandica]BCJ39241.1 hypothetical protein Athai_67440 [Actinocatenispora thailandica]
MTTPSIAPGASTTRSAATAPDRSSARLAGWAGGTVGVLSVLLVALYFVYSGPPPAWNVLTRSLLTLAIVAVLTLFGVALSRLLPVDDGGWRTVAGQLSIVSLLTYGAVILFATSLEAGTPLAYPGRSLDPTTDGPLAAAMALAHGPIAHLWIAMFFLGFVRAVRRSTGPRIVPGWTLGGSVVVAAINLLAVPSLYFGMNAADFYAVNGWGADALVGLVTLMWVGCIGLGIHRARTKR